MKRLYHYTCDCGRSAIGDVGQVLPLSMHNPEAAAKLPAEWSWLADLAWFTDQWPPDAVELGLTRLTIACDRTKWRYQATDTSGLLAWRQVAPSLPRNKAVLTQADHTPGRWWVSRAPVPVELVAT